MVAALALALCALAGEARAGAAQYPGTLWLSGPRSAITGHTGSYQLIGSLSAAPTATVAGAGVIPAGTYAYVYTVVGNTADTGATEMVSATASARTTVTLAGASSVTVGNLPTGVNVRIYRARTDSPASPYYYRVAQLANNASSTYTDNLATSATTLSRSENRSRQGQTGYAEFSPTVVPALEPASLLATPTSPNKKGWIVDGAGAVHFPSGTWTFTAQTRSVAPDGAAVLSVAMWKVDAYGAAVGGPVLAPTEAVHAPASLVTSSNSLQTVTLTVDAVPAFSLEPGEHLYVQYWRRQTTAYALSGPSGPTNRIATMFSWDGIAKVTHPAVSSYASEPTLVAPTGVAASRTFSATFNDPDASDSGTVDFRLCGASAAAGAECATLIDSGTSSSVAKGATATWTTSSVLSSGTYYWQARGRDALGGASAWTATQSFTVVNPNAPATPILASPAAGATAATAQPLAANYSDGDGHAGTLEFRVCSVSAAAGSECSALVASGTTAVANGARGTWSVVGVPLVEGTYHWQARAHDLFGAASGWSATRTVVVDTTPPPAPGLGGVVVDGRLVLRWLPAPGSGSLRYFVLYVDGEQWRTLGGSTFEEHVGRFDASDTRRFSISAVDEAGNAGPRSDEIVGVPNLAGLSPAEAEAALAARGLVLGEQRRRALAAAELVVVDQEPHVPALVVTGSPVTVVLGPEAEIESRPLLQVTGSQAHSCATRALVRLRVSLRAAARVTLKLVDRRGKTVASKRPLALGAGEWTVELPVAARVRRPARYTLVVTALGDGESRRVTRSVALGRPKRGKTCGTRSGDVARGARA